MADLTKLVDELSSLTVLEAAELAHRAGDQREFIIQQLPRKIACYLRPEILQLAARRRVEGLRLHAGHAHGAQAIAHFSGRSRREGHRKHALRAHKALVDQVGNAIGNSAGLARTRASQDAHGPARRRGRAQLIFIQQGQIRLSHRDTTP